MRSDRTRPGGPAEESPRPPAFSALLLRFAVEAWRGIGGFGAQDAYKWLYQAVLGAEHAVTDAERASRLLEEEWRTLTEPLPGEPLLTPLRPDGRVVRVNLRPFRARGDDPARLLTAFLRTASEFRGRERFADVWSLLPGLLSDPAIGPLPFSVEDWREVDRKARARGYPALHHSPDYERTRRPAYRVVLGRFLRDLPASPQDGDPIAG